MRKTNNIENHNFLCIIPARGGSKSIPKKNIIDFCGKPLIAWSIEQASKSKYIKDVYISTDENEIADISEKYGAKIIWRPAEIATDFASSESALLHAICEIEKKQSVNSVVFLQATSPLRTSNDINDAIEKFISEKADSLFSSAILEDFCIWEITERIMKSITYDYKRRGRRQEKKPYYLENGSIYVFKSSVLKKENNRLGGKIINFLMPFWKSYQIDIYEDLEICEYYMKNKILNEHLL